MMDTKLIAVAVTESESMIVSLMSAADQMRRTIEAETHLRRMLKEAEQALETAEAETLYEAEIAAQEKSGPLANFAKTSTGYKAAITKLLADERRNGSALGELSRQVDGLRVRLDQAQIEREQASVQFSACKHAALCGARPSERDAFRFLEIESPVPQAEICCAACQERFAKLWGDAVNTAPPPPIQRQRGQGR